MIILSLITLYLPFLLILYLALYLKKTKKGKIYSYTICLAIFCFIVEGLRFGLPLLLTDYFAETVERTILFMDIMNLTRDTLFILSLLTIIIGIKKDIR